MIELTDQQAQALESPEAIPPRVINPRTKETFVLLRVEEYERFKKQDYDDSDWTREELQALAWEMTERLDWEECVGAPIEGSPTEETKIVGPASAQPPSLDELLHLVRKENSPGEWHTGPAVGKEVW